MKIIRPRQAIVSNQRGSAIMFAMFLMSLLIFIAFEVSYDSVIEYQASLNSVRKVQAYYAAKACNDLSLLRIKAYQQVSRSGILKNAPDPSMGDMIWKFPLSWPIVPPTTISDRNQADYQKANKASTFKHQFSAQITSESGKIDINDLGSPAKALRDKTKQQFLDLFNQLLQEDTPWAQKYSSYDFNELLNNISDWVDSDALSLNGGDEGGLYSDLKNEFLPPNQPFKTLDEIHMVKGMEDDIFNVITPVITLFGGKGINVNYADKKTLMAIDPAITDEVAGEIIKRRSDINLGGPFKEDDNGKDFLNFLSQFGIDTSNFNKDKIPLYYGQEINFRLSCIGAVGNINREVTSIVYDYQTVQTRLTESLKKDKPKDPNDPCLDFSGDLKYNCECKKTESEGTPKFTACVDRLKKAGGGGATPPKNQPLPPGPPYVIFYDVK